MAVTAEQLKNLRQLAEACLPAIERMEGARPGETLYSMGEDAQIDADVELLNSLARAANPAMIIGLLVHIDEQAVEIDSLNTELSVLTEDVELSWRRAEATEAELAMQVADALLCLSYRGGER